MTNDAARNELAEVLALVEAQLGDIAAVQEKQRAMTACAKEADGAVEVTVDFRGHVREVTVDESYLDDHELADLGEHLTRAAQAAIREIDRRVSELMTPINDRRMAFPSLSDIVEGAPDFRDLLPDWAGLTGAPTPTRAAEDDGDPPFPTVRG
ncbi:YbaB/EbfC family nucleoid-associated protein [Mycolicibacterium arenosum]|uniref:YbaB/EbfC family nucleoid-associated protein n=1 Tax=Mycolicibacterium arenosum TaxID=2952157 RepID=A0ABT1LXC6_9MYCO|nr:YbaB/EbfC family nucleoid-associated protein [Mycolicibacterium sp. CAU 1645]MCP9271554.1 YbaB/EbfC family nucleoid-associated protein [Mycolicibacterium sp. CAU 1645]